MVTHECDECGETFDRGWLLKAHKKNPECAVVTCHNDADIVAKMGDGPFKPYCQSCSSGSRSALIEESHAI